MSAHFPLVRSLCSNLYHRGQQFSSNTGQFLYCVHWGPRFNRRGIFAGTHVLSLQRWFVSPPLLVSHTEPSSAGTKANRCVIHTRKPPAQLLKRCDGTSHDDDVCAFKAFLWCPPVSLHPPSDYNLMDADIMCSDWDPDPPNILASDKVTFSTLLFSSSKMTRNCLKSLTAEKMP